MLVHAGQCDHPVLVLTHVALVAQLLTILVQLLRPLQVLACASTYSLPLPAMQCQRTLLTMTQHTMHTINTGLTEEKQ